MYKTYKFRLYPTIEEIRLIDIFFYYARLVYNHYLWLEKKYKKGISAHKCIKDFRNNMRKMYPMLRKVDSNLIKNSILDLENAYKKYNELGYGVPRYKSAYDRNSYTTNAIYNAYKDKRYCNIEVDLINMRVKLPKLKWIKIKGYRNIKKIDGRIMFAIVSKEQNGKYYVSVVCKVPSIHRVNATSIVGIDIGVKNLLTLSNSIIINNNKYIQNYEKRINRYKRNLTRKKKGSKNYYKCKKKLAILYGKLKNARRFYIHSITKKITDNYDIIVCENLNIKNMINKNSSLSQRILDATFNEIVRQLEYKSNYKGKYFIKIDAYYPSSRVCSVCGNIDNKYKDLSKREYSCQKCYNELDRDLNASINIMFEGLKKYMKATFNNKRISI